MHKDHPALHEATRLFVEQQLMGLEQDLQRAKKIKATITSLKGLYAELDPVAEKVAKEASSPCEAGCNHCCYILTLCSIPEGLVLAEAVLKRPDWKAVGRDLRQMAKVTCNPELTHGLYFRKQLACALLDKKTGQCSAYAERPSACRFHYVITEPELCSIGPEPKSVKVIDFRDLERRVWAHCAQLFPMTMTAPLPLVVLFCMPMLKKDKYFRQLLSGLPDPARWFYVVREQIPQLAKEAVGERGGEIVLNRSNLTEETADEDEDAG